MNIKYNVTEGKQLNVTVISSRPFTTNFIVHINTSVITATGKYKCMATRIVGSLIVVADFNLSSSNVLFDFSSGQETTFTVNIIDDTIYEPRNSSFVITIVVPEAAKLLGVTLGENSTATISIIDDDS